MKKTMIWILSLILVLVSALACAESADSFFGQFAGMEWTFCSGAGAWSTDLRIGADGSFTGEYHDSEMGEADTTYPDGTIYIGSFSGRLALLEQLDDNSWKVKVESLTLPDAGKKEEIEDGVRYVYTEPYGVAEGWEMTLYKPGTPVSVLPEDMHMWLHLYDQETPAETLTDWFLCSVENDVGFLAYTLEEVPQIPAPAQ